MRVFPGVAIESARPRRAGGQTTLTTVVEQRICILVSCGVPLTRAAEMAGVSKGTAYGWLTKAHSPNASPEILQFADSLAAARTEFVRTVLRRLEQLDRDQELQHEAAMKLLSER